MRVADFAVAGYAVVVGCCGSFGGLAEVVVVIVLRWGGGWRFAWETMEDARAMLFETGRRSIEGVWVRNCESLDFCCNSIVHCGPRFLGYLALRCNSYNGWTGPRASRDGAAV